MEKNNASEAKKGKKRANAAPSEQVDILEEFFDVLRLAKIPFGVKNIDEAKAAIETRANLKRSEKPDLSEIESEILKMAHRILPRVVLIAIGNIEDEDCGLKDVLLRWTALIEAKRQADYLHEQINREDATLEKIQNILDTVPINALSLLQLRAHARASKASLLEKKLVRELKGRPSETVSDEIQYIDNVVRNNINLSPEAIFQLVYTEAGKPHSPYYRAGDRETETLFLKMPHRKSNTDSEDDGTEDKLLMKKQVKRKISKAKLKVKEEKPLEKGHRP